ncbi:hypothetical protein [Thermogemmata fonticola]|uniref:Uncharacterized protein n=1 Tax=Thermogemmata fonticola TaxID=2755323 RepID=A0A7V9AA62_9BACT|nr:hypothetical protein [Thermogemmata fonticola]MBA2224678.1 hypothetical protein [Thermogemmata fonticola]
MPSYHDWKDLADEWAALGDVATDEFRDRDLEIRPAWEDFAAIDRQVRDLTESEQPASFHDLWLLLTKHLELGDKDDRSRWETRCLAELSWFLLQGSDDAGFRVWDADKLREHLRRLKALDLPVREHETEGIAFVREAMYWPGESLAAWERLIEVTGSESSMEALNAALTSLARSRCSDWPEASIDDKLFGYYSLTSPDGGGILIDLAHDWNARTMCQIGWEYGPDWSGYESWLLDYADPDLLAAFTERLRDVGLDPRPPEWPLE